MSSRPNATNQAQARPFTIRRDWSPQVDPHRRTQFDGAYLTQCYDKDLSM
jgi:hypothetical protein